MEWFEYITNQLCLLIILNSSKKLHKIAQYFKAQPQQTIEICGKILVKVITHVGVGTQFRLHSLFVTKFSSANCENYNIN